MEATTDVPAKQNVQRCGQSTAVLSSRCVRATLGKIHIAWGVRAVRVETGPGAGAQTASE